LCDFAVPGIAIEPHLPQFAGASAGVSNGLLVDERCQAAWELLAGAPGPRASPEAAGAAVRR
jgi:hypothetical protein